MDKNTFVKLGVVGMIALVGANVYTNVKRIKAQKEQEVIDITPEDTPQK